MRLLRKWSFLPGWKSCWFNEYNAFHSSRFNCVTLVLQIGESVVQEGCHERITCKPSGEVTHESIKCKGYEICQIQNGVCGCHPAQCLIEEGGSITLFSGISGGLTETGTYEIVKVCDGALDAQWFRVVVEVLMCGETGWRGVAAVYVFYEGGIISVNRQLSTWVCFYMGKSIGMPSFKGIVQPKTKMLSFAHPQEMCCSNKHKGIYLKECQ